MSRSHNLARLFSAVRGLVASWWSLDRIRTTPRHGRLLRIAPGTCLFVRGTMFEIVGQKFCETSQGTLVCHEIRGPQGPSELWIAPESPESVLWIHERREEQLLADEIEIWGRDELRSFTG